MGRGRITRHRRRGRHVISKRSTAVVAHSIAVAVHSSTAASSSRVLAPVVISAGVPGASPLLVVHAERDIAIF